MHQQTTHAVSYIPRLPYIQFCYTLIQAAYSQICNHCKLKSHNIKYGDVHVSLDNPSGHHMAASHQRHEHHLPGVLISTEVASRNFANQSQQFGCRVRSGKIFRVVLGSRLDSLSSVACAYQRCGHRCCWIRGAILIFDWKNLNTRVLASFPTMHDRRK